MRKLLLLIMASTSLVLVGCSAQAVPLTPAGQAVDARKGDPPPGSRELGPIEVRHGNGCGGFGTKGSYDGALAMLRNKAAEKGANYVQLMTMTEPHSTGNCYDNEFIIRGVAYRLDSSGQATTQPASTCEPPCSPGYSCQAGQCIPVCNPPCDPGETCNSKRVCVKP